MANTKTRTESVLRARSEPARESAPPAPSPAPSDEALAYLGGVLQEQREVVDARLEEIVRAKEGLAPVAHEVH